MFGGDLNVGIGWSHLDSVVGIKVGEELEELFDVGLQIPGLDHADVPGVVRHLCLWCRRGVEFKEPGVLESRIDHQKIIQCPEIIIGTLLENDLQGFVFHFVVAARGTGCSDQTSRRLCHCR